MKLYVVFGREYCSHCDSAKELLETKGLDYLYYDVSLPKNSRLREVLVSDVGAVTVPQIFQLVGGADDLLLKLLKEE